MIEQFYIYLNGLMAKNTAIHKMKIIKKILKIAIEEGYIRAMPFKIKLAKDTLQYTPLSLDELRTIRSRQFATGRMAQVRDVFIFACYSGLAFTDLKNLTKEDILTDEDGKETTVKKTVEVVDPNTAHSIYSIVFCEGNTGWTRNAELNKVFLIQQQNYANDKLKMNGILTLNEVYDMVGAPRTAYGQIAGWVYTDDSSIGDNFVDFGSFDVNNEKACDFINGREKSIILDFNCIGNILDYI